MLFLGLPRTVAWVLSFLVLGGCASAPASAAAWTLHAGDERLLSNALFSRADRQFGGGAPDFDKLYFNTVGEYGLTDGITLFAGQEYARARWRSGGEIILSETVALEAGGRLRLHGGDAGALSLQATVFSSAGLGLPDAPGDARRVELRLLYGRSFGDAGFVDVEAATRLVDGCRFGEHAFDVSAGLWLTPGWMAMIQGFNVLRDGASGYRMHKLELSLVGRLAQNWALRIGMLFTPAGADAPVEQGVEISLWVDV